MLGHYPQTKFGDSHKILNKTKTKTEKENKMNCKTCENMQTHTTLDELFNMHENDPLLAKHVAIINPLGYMPETENYYADSIKELWAYLIEELTYTYENELIDYGTYITALNEMTENAIASQTNTVLVDDYAYTVQENY